MPLVSMKQILEEADRNNYGVGAFNVNNMEQVQAIMAAAVETKSPVIIQASRGALKYSDFIYLKHLMFAAVESNPQIPVAVHLDHGDTFEACKKAIELGFSSVMIDGSLKPDHSTPNDLDGNIAITKEVVDYAHRLGVTVEGELGTIGGAEEDMKARNILLADPAEAKEFVSKTKVDCLAAAIGTSHGAYKFDSPPKLAIDIISDIRKLLPGTPIVMHGSSSVPGELIDLINKYGGNMEKKCGTPMEEIKKAIKAGVRKINVDTDSRLILTGTIRKVLHDMPAEFDPRKYLGPARDANAKLISGKMKDFGSAGHAFDYKPKSLAEYKKIYEGD